MKTCIELLTQLMRETHCYLSDEHLAWDQFSLDWQEHSRKKPNAKYASAIWAMAKGYLDALTPKSESLAHPVDPRHQRAIFRERISNLAVACVKESEEAVGSTENAILILKDDQELILAIQNLEKEIKKYFVTGKI